MRRGGDRGEQAVLRAIGSGTIQTGLEGGCWRGSLLAETIERSSWVLRFP